MATGLTVLTSALQSLQVLLEGATPNANQQALGLIAINRLLDQMNAQRLFIYVIREEDFTWPAATASRTIGASGNFNTTWPNKLEYAVYRDSENRDEPLTATEDRIMWERVHDKTLASDRPSMIFYEKAYPLGTLHVWPVPSVEWTLRLSSWRQLTALATINDTLTFPPGYESFLMWNLAKHMWPTFPTQGVQQLVFEMAASTQGIVKRYNTTPVPTLSVQELAEIRTSAYNITTDGYA